MVGGRDEGAKGRTGDVAVAPDFARSVLLARGQREAPVESRNETAGKSVAGRRSVAAVMTQIDLNCDLAEGYGAWEMDDTASLLSLVSSANVACGFHAGDPGRMREALGVAVARGVAIGAHVGYPDRRGFGRVDYHLPAETIADDVVYQVGALVALAAREGGRVGYVKAHGALYHRLNTDPQAAYAVAHALAQLRARFAGAPLGVLAPPNSAFLAAAAEVGLRSFREGFLDRRYRADGSLVPRRDPYALLEGEDAIAQATALALGDPVGTAEGGSLQLQVDSLCLHGDTPGAVGRATAVVAALREAGIVIAPFSEPAPVDPGTAGSGTGRPGALGST